MYRGGNAHANNKYQEFTLYEVSYDKLITNSAALKDRNDGIACKCTCMEAHALASCTDEGAYALLPTQLSFIQVTGAT